MYRQGSNGWTSMRNEEFQEDDVWDVLLDTNDFNSHLGTTPKLPPSPIFPPRALPSASKMIPRSHNNPITHEFKILQQSAPVKIPDWSKIYQNKSKSSYNNNSSWLDYNDKEDEDEYTDDEDVKPGRMIPPHVWLAKKYERNQISSFSVCEGVGRTLKGRDLSRVRNAVLTSTGFLE